MAEPVGPAMTALVAHASRNGATRDVAERIAARLDESGLHCELSRLPDGNPNTYDTVVLGSAVYAGAWLPEAIEMVRRNEWVLARKPVWTFSVGWLSQQRGMLRRFVWPDAQEQLADVHVAIGPHGHRFFAGAIRAPGLSLRQRLLFRALGGRYGDYRDWPQIDAWADHIAEQVLGIDHPHPVGHNNAGPDHRRHQQS